MALALLCAGAFASVAPAGAAGPETDDRARSVIELEVQVDGGEPFQVTVWEGAAVTVRSDRHDLNLVVVPSVTHPAGGQLSLWVGEVVDETEDGVVTGAPIEVAAQVDHRQPLAYFPVDVEVLDVRPPTKEERETVRPAPADVSSSGNSSPGGGIIAASGICCVTCGGDELCACKVRATCGSCCDGCCGTDIAK